MRLLNILVIGALILAASFVYKIKFDSTLQAERVGKVAAELRRERNTIATLRAEWSRLDTPARIQGLADRNLKMRPIVSSQFDTLDRLPERPLPTVQPPIQDPIGAMIGPMVASPPTAPPDATGSIAPGAR
jgi:cell division protein FtsL